MKEVALIIAAGAIGLTTFVVIAKKFGKDCIP